MHGACFSPCDSTWCKAIDNGFFKSWTGLTSARVRRFIKVSEATSKWYFTRERQKLRSTRQLHCVDRIITVADNDNHLTHYNSDLRNDATNVFTK